jgi:hypothetical protein
MTLEDNEAVSPKFMLADGKLVEHTGLFDTMALLQQLGVVPARAPAPAAEARHA